VRESTGLAERAAFLDSGGGGGVVSAGLKQGIIVEEDSDEDE
jgi:hypothetical protein